MGDHHLQLHVLSHPVNTVFNYCGNQIFHASYKVFMNVSTVLPKVYIPYNGLFFRTIFKCPTKMKKVIHFVICGTTVTEIFCNLGCICHLVFFIFARQFAFEVQGFKLRKTDVHFSFNIQTNQHNKQFLNGIESFFLQVRTF